MREFFFVNRYPLWILSISLSMIALEVGWSHFVGTPPLFEPINFAQPTHLRKELHVFAGSSYWLDLTFLRKGRKYEDLTALFGGMETSGVTFPVTLRLQKKDEGQNLIDSQFYANGAQGWSNADVERVLATPKLEPGDYLLSLDMPAVPEWATENAHLELSINTKTSGSWKTGLGFWGGLASIFVFAPAVLIALILLVFRLVIRFLKTHRAEQA